MLLENMADLEPNQLFSTVILIIVCIVFSHAVIMASYDYNYIVSVLHHIGRICNMYTLLLSAHYNINRNRELENL